MIDRDNFFARIRIAPFGGAMTQSQVEGCNAILDEWERRKLTDMRWLAYMLATTFHETAAAMQPVIETRQPGEAKNPSVDTAIARLERAWANGKMPWVKYAYWRKDARGLSWLGRGLPQVTHEDNYKWAEIETGIKFTKNPDLMLEMRNAIPVMFIGMLRGKFTGRRLSDYFSANENDPVNARRIINGTESAAKVAGHYADFLRALKSTNAPIQITPAKPKSKTPEAAAGAVVAAGGAVSATKAGEAWGGWGYVGAVVVTVLLVIVVIAVIRNRGK